MSNFRTETMTISIDYTTDGEVVNRIRGSHGSGGKLQNQVMIAYLEQFANLKVQSVNKYELKQAISDAIDKHLDYDREANV